MYDTYPGPHELPRRHLGGNLGGLPTTPQLPNLSVQQVQANLPSGAPDFTSYAASYNASAAQPVGSAALHALANGSISNADIVNAYSAAVATVPVVGPVMAALTQFIYANSAAISGAINQFFTTIGIVGCHPQNKSLADWQSTAQIPTPAAGTLASAILPVLLQSWADWASCNPLAHGISYMDWKTQLVPAIASLWNSNAPGPAIDYFIPAMYDGSLFCPNQGNMLCQSGTQGQYFFQPLDNVPTNIRGIEGLNWYRISANAGPLSSVSSAAAAQAKQAAVTAAQNANASAQAAATSAGLSTGGKVAATAGAVTLATAIGVGIFAWAKGETFKWALGKTWKNIREPFKRRR